MRFYQYWNGFIWEFNSLGDYFLAVLAAALVGDAVCNREHGVSREIVCSEFLCGGLPEATFPIVACDGCAPRLAPVVQPEGLSEANFYNLIPCGVVVPFGHGGERRLGRLNDQDAGLGGAEGGVGKDCGHGNVSCLFVAPDDSCRVAGSQRGVGPADGPQVAHRTRAYGGVGHGGSPAGQQAVARARFHHIGVSLKVVLNQAVAFWIGDDVHPAPLRRLRLGGEYKQQEKAQQVELCFHSVLCGFNVLRISLWKPALCILPPAGRNPMAGRRHPT